MRALIKNITAVLKDKTAVCDILVADGKILEIGENIEDTAALTIDGTDKILTPGFVELHSHGCGGYDFLDNTPEAFRAMADCYLSHGTTSVLPTAVSCSKAALIRLAEIFEIEKENSPVNLLGLHLEGPFLSMEMKGAQSPDFVRLPSRREVDELYEAAGSNLKMITVAPEIGGDMDYLIDAANKNGTVLSIGHSEATAAEVIEAHKKGFRRITHMYSATTTNRKIGQTVYSGIVEAAYLLDNMFVELIGDGKHIPKETMQLALKIKGADHVTLTSDSMRAAGTDVTESYLGEIRPENRVIIEEGVAKLPDRSFYAGSIATGDKMLKNAVQNYGINIVDAVKMLCTTPAAVIGNGEIGVIAEGKAADLLIFDKDLNLETVFCKNEMYSI